MMVAALENMPQGNTRRTWDSLHRESHVKWDECTHQDIPILCEWFDNLLYISRDLALSTLLVFHSLHPFKI